MLFEAHSINAEHKDLIHDVAYDFYGQRMATCSSDQFVKVSHRVSLGCCEKTSKYGAPFLSRFLIVTDFLRLCLLWTSPRPTSLTSSLCSYWETIEF